MCWGLSDEEHNPTSQRVSDRGQGHKANRFVCKLHDRPLPNSRSRHDCWQAHLLSTRRCCAAASWIPRSSFTKHAAILGFACVCMAYSYCLRPHRARSKPQQHCENLNEFRERKNQLAQVGRGATLHESMCRRDM